MERANQSDRSDQSAERSLQRFVRRNAPVLQMTEEELTAAMKDIVPEKFAELQREIDEWLILRHS